MKVYIIKETPGQPAGADDLRIIKVHPEDEAAFMRTYGSKIIVAGSSIQDVLTKFSLHVNDYGQ